MDSKRKILLQTVCGMPMSVGYSPEMVKEAVNYKAQSGDVFFVAYTKCGSTWSQAILINICRKGAPPSEKYQMVHPVIPLLEVVGSESVKNRHPPRLTRTHLPFDLQPYSPDAKYIYMARNPKDCCVSFYHHTKNLPVYQFTDGTLSDFVEFFIKGEVDAGDYFSHVLSWYEHRDDPNVLFLTYEDMKSDPHANILKMARFLGKEYSDPLESDPTLLDNVVRFSNFEFMKDRVNDHFTDLFQRRTEDDIDKLPLEKGIKLLMKRINSVEFSPPQRINFLRKGQVGDWRTQLTVEQSERLDQRFAEVLGHTNLAEIWKKHMELR